MQPLIDEDDNDFIGYRKKYSNVLSKNESFVLINHEYTYTTEDLRVDFPNQILDPEISTKNQKPENTTEKNLFERYFSKINEGSFRAGLISVCIFSLGATVITIPLKFSKIGLFVGWGILFIVSTIAYTTMNILIKLSCVYKINSYSVLTKRILGPKFAKFLDSLIVINNLGAITLHLVLIYKLIGTIYFDVYGVKGTLDEFFEKSFWGNLCNKAIFVCSIAFLMIALIFKYKKIYNIRIPSFFGFLSVVFCVGIILGQSYWYIKNYWDNIYYVNNKKTWINLYDIEKGFDSNFFFFRTFSTLFYGYSYHIGIIPICSSLKKNNILAKKKILRRSIYSYTIIYFISGTIGLLSCPINTPDLIIQRYKLFNSDWLMNIGRSLIIMTYLMKIPINFKAYKISVYSLYTDQPDIQTKHDVFITLSSLIFCSTVATFYMKIQNYFDILGGFCSVNISVFYFIIRILIRVFIIRIFSQVW